ncbi:glutathione peroxidase 1-like [Babylonia areolata]|uniref:glutathione peroxidase 1-like n=1 Tax=Babylonia areolata TaxID=304850 RepID=UPI003FD0E4DB
MSNTQGDKPVPAGAVSSLYQLSALLINDRMEALSRYEGRVCLVVNMASADPSTRSELTKLNELVRALGPRGLSVLVFPCNQLGGLEPFQNDEIPLLLQYVRPGSGFQPLFQLFAKSDVNGCHANPVYEFLRLKQPRPVDNGTILSRDRVTWCPIARDDVGGNYEKFLVNFEGQPVKRYTHKASLEQVRGDVETQLRKIPKMIREHLGLVAPDSHHIHFK